MSKTKHTPRPWRVENHTEHTGPYTSARLEVWNHNRHIGTIHEHVDDKCIDEANARLIAAAPELLEALEWILGHVARNTLGTVKTEHGVGTVVDAHLIRVKIKAALTKATGGSDE